MSGASCKANGAVYPPSSAMMNSVKKPKMEQIQADHELFLQAFESKISQLVTRCIVMPSVGVANTKTGFYAGENVSCQLNNFVITCFVVFIKFWSACLLYWASSSQCLPIVNLTQLYFRGRLYSALITCNNFWSANAISSVSNAVYITIEQTH